MWSTDAPCAGSRGKKKARGAALFTSSIPEIGFVRVSVHRASGRLAVRQAAEVLRGMLASLGPVRRFLPDDVNGLEWSAWCGSAGRTEAVPDEKKEIARTGEGV